MNHAKNIYCGTLATLLFSGGMLAPYHRQHPDAGQETCGRYTRQQAVDMSAPLVQAMLPHEQDIYGSARSQNVIQRDGKPQPLWIVEYGAANAPGRVQVMCNAETGKINQISIDAAHSLRNRGALRCNARAAAARAQDWLHLIDPAVPWAFAGKPERRAATWHVALRSPASRAVVVIDGLDGSLLYAEIK